MSTVFTFYAIVAVVTILVVYALVHLNTRGNN